ncbi:hypothetical protein BC941DRAFT_448110 [Chlamydoabsidia padenii]|nr:hypothetical protein BC941DRAFT_448110 [Chlamydoabsidia padenii]
MDSLYPLDTSDGWRYPACEGLLERYSNGEWTTKAGSSTTTEHNVNWCDKYRPDKVIYLLDNQSHHCYLRDWLERHKVAPTKTDPSFFAPRKKVTRRDMENHYTKDYDDGGGDEDDDFMPTAQFTKKNRSPKKRNKKDLNMILLVGPHGVGKTAGVFTAARETGYQVFEIHPGLKRSLKEVHRLVGDMTKNHLVRFHKQGDDNKPGGNQPYLDKSFGGGDSGDDDNDGYGNSDLDMDADSQQTTTTKSNQLLTQFFISKSTTTRPKQPTQPSSHVSTKQDQLSMATQQQYGPKQSLILLEEVDLVYQSDKGFWNGVTDLARTNISVIPFDILQLQAIIHYEAPLRQLLLPYLHLICLIEGYDISVLDLTAWVNLIGPDIRQLLMTLEYLHYQQGPLLLGDNQSYRMPLSHNSNHDNNAMLQSHMDLLMNQAENDTMQQQQQPWLHISDHIPGAQMTPLCMQLVENDSRPTRLEITNEPLDNDNNDEVLEKLVAWMDNRSLIDYGVGMDDIKISQIYGLDEYGPNDDQTSGHLHSWKKSNDWDHCDMQAYMESSLLDMNHPQKGSGLIDIMSWEMICDQRYNSSKN